MICYHKFVSIKKGSVILVLMFIISNFYSHAVESKSIVSESSNVRKVDKHEKFIKKLEKTRTLMVNDKMIMPMLVGMLLKMVTVIPVILIVAIVIGGISVIGSKISLIISLVLGARALYSMIPAEPKDTAAMSYEDYTDLANIMAKQRLTNAIKQKSYIPMEMLKQGMLKPSDLMQANLNQQQMQDMYANYRNLVSYEKSYYPAPDFAYSPNDAGYSTIGAIDMNRTTMDQASQVAGVHTAQDMDQSNERLAEIFAQKQAKVYALAEMAKKANDMKKHGLENSNRRMGIKIIKSVTERASD